MDFLNEFKTNASSGNYYYLFYIVVLLILIFLLKGRRVRFVIPAIVLTLFIFNPIVYKYWNKLGLYAYWRVMWVIPVIPVCATLPSILAEKIKNNILKNVVGIMLVLIFIPLGGYIYNSEDGRFEFCADNYSKLPQSVVEVSMKLLEEDDNPRIVADPSIGVYIRQFSGRIDTLYGRDIYGYIDGITSNANLVNANLKLENGDMSYVANVMLNEGYDYLVVPYSSEKRKTSLEKAGFTTIDSIAGYDIYKVHGTPTVLKNRNHLGQVIREVTLDRYGNPTDGARGYSTVEYTYDRNGNVATEFHLDINNKPVADEGGVAGYERTFDRSNRVLTEKFLGTDKEIIINSSIGYAEKRLKYKGSDLISESYYDTNGYLIQSIYGYAGFEREYDNDIIKEKYIGKDGELISIPAGYAIVERKIDENNNILKESYYGVDGYPIACVKGYANIERQYNSNGQIVSENYYDKNGEAWYMPAGYCGIKQNYYEDGSLQSREYLDSSGQVVSRNDGYSKVVWEIEQSSGTINAVFYDNSGNKISYNGLNLVMDGPIGWSEWMTPKYNVQNSCFEIGVANLGEKQEGDIYNCRMEIEFKGVESSDGKPFSFWTQGAVDSEWKICNVWNPKLVSLEKAPLDGIYKYSYSCIIEGDSVAASNFIVGLRCDNWKSGSFRVKNVMIEKGGVSDEWNQGP